MGLYRFPETCDHERVGSCRYLVMWSRIPGTYDRIRFQIHTQNKEKWSAVGFSPTKHLVRSLYTVHCSASKIKAGM